MSGTTGGRETVLLVHPLRLLDANSALRIDEALAKLGPRGEVRLIKKNGKVRFLETLRIESAIGGGD